MQQHDSQAQAAKPNNKLTCPRHLLLCTCLLIAVCPRARCLTERARIVRCESEQQQIMCGLIPFEAHEERSTCCSLYSPHSTRDTSTAISEPGMAAGVQIPASTDHTAASVLPPAAAGIGGIEVNDTVTELPPAELEPGNMTTGIVPPPAAVLPLRPDLQYYNDSSDHPRDQYNELFPSNCTPVTQANIPVLTSANATTDEMNAAYQIVPVLSKDSIKLIKAHALDSLRTANSSSLAGLWNKYATYSSSSSSSTNSTFSHPSGYISAAELAYMQQQLSDGFEPQMTAVERLLTGEGVPPKMFEPNATWALPTACPAQGYEGPYATPSVLIRYGGISDPRSSPCAGNYPVDAPQRICGHLSFVELDGQMSYKQAVAFWATGDVRHAQTALEIIDSWSSTNTQFGLYDQNGPLEAAWGCASFSRALELLLHHPGWGVEFGGDGVYERYVTWVSGVLMPQMDAWIEFKKPFKGHWSTWMWDGNVYANWHASIAECWMSFAILTNSITRYNMAVDLYHATIRGYLKWGRGRFAAGRLIGESTETLRDIYHTLFGLGSLLQTAEMAWQARDEDLYSSYGHVLAAAMEVHARIINAGANETLLPPGFRFFHSMPAPPDGTVWRINLGRQVWSAVNVTTGAWVVDLIDGFKYVLGSKYLPTGWEIGYNHFVGRLGLHLPETSKLLSSYWPEYYEFHWGLGTLTHAGSAQWLWRPGIETFCADQVE